MSSMLDTYTYRQYRDWRRISEDLSPCFWGRREGDADAHLFFRIAGLWRMSYSQGLCFRSHMLDPETQLNIFVTTGFLGV